MCFVDLKKAYDSVDREMLWKVLAGAEIPAKLIKVIRQFHDGIQARVYMDEGELSGWFFVTHSVRQGCVPSPLLFNIFFAEVLEVVVIRFSKDDVVLRSLVRLEEGKTEARGGEETPLDRVRWTIWGMLHAHDAGVVSRSAEGLARMMTIIVEVFGEFGLTVSEKKTETLLMPAKDKPTTTTQPSPPPPLTTEAAGQKNAQTTEWPRDVAGELFDRPKVPFRVKIRLLQAKAIEVLLYGCMTWSPLCGHYQTLRSIHHRLLLRVIGYKRKKDTYRQLSYAQTLKRVGCQSVEATIRQRRLLFARALARQPDGRLPKRLMLGELAGGGEAT
ncbi:unnamed protein product [Ectocarpus sp. CCAP 1310/34]|nr:unnamed protein product [Ectocarpus sp. CCAP 1310/34]